MNDEIIKQEKKLMKFVDLYLKDKNLNVWHLAILNAVVNLGFQQGQRKRIKVSRSLIMKLSHINTIPTYHKYFKQLQDFGYIRYKPSYHPSRRSEIKLYEKRLSQDL